MSAPRLIGTIELREGAFGIATGCAFYPIEGSSGIAHDFREQFNLAVPYDVGKRVYNDRGVIVMENSEQRDARLKPADAAFHPSSFGGGWIVPNSDEAREFLERYFAEPATELASIGGKLGYIVESYEARDLIEAMEADELGISK